MTSSNFKIPEKKYEGKDVVKKLKKLYVYKQVNKKYKKALKLPE